MNSSYFSNMRKSFGIIQAFNLCMSRGDQTHDLLAFNRTIWPIFYFARRESIGFFPKGKGTRDGNEADLFGGSPSHP